MFRFVAFSQFQILSRCLLRFLDKSVQKNHSFPFVDVEEHASNSVRHEARSHFKDAAKRPANRHAHRPTKLDSLNVLSDALTILWRKPFQPLAYRLAASFRTIEDCRNPFALWSMPY